MTARKSGLGRNLNALLSSQAVAVASPTSVASADNPLQDRQLKQLPIEFLQPGEYQPRRDMEPEALKELAESIKNQGIIQPIVVRKKSNNHFEIIAGERRWRAAQLAGLSDVPAIITSLDDQATLAVALIENIQREDLNPLEEAIALSRLIDEFDLTHQQVAEAVGKSRAAVSNLLRLMSLSDSVKILLQRGDIEMGHARALLPLDADQQLLLAKTIALKNLSVREAERLVKNSTKPSPTKPKTSSNPDIMRLERQLSDILGANTQITHQKGRGKILIEYHDLSQLEGLLERFGAD